VIAALWSLVASAADEPKCTKVGLTDLVPEETGPAILVLGERPNEEVDSDRMFAAVKKLAKRGPVTLALQALPRELADEMGQLERGEIQAATVSTETVTAPDGATTTHRTYLVRMYPEGREPLVKHVVPIGVPLGARKPADLQLPMPPLYIHPLAEAMGEGKMPPELEPRFVEQVAWIDHQLASGAIDGWDGTGFLVIVVDRLHVQGGLGVAWQASQLTDVPVHQALLANAGTQCVDADRVLRSSLFTF